MELCDNCVAESWWQVGQRESAGLEGVCDCCGRRVRELLPAARWGAEVAELLDLYEKAENGKSVAEAVNRHWSVIPNLKCLTSFLRDAAPGHPVLDYQAVRLRGDDFDERWDEFAEHIRHASRFRVKAPWQQDLMADALSGQRLELLKGTRLFRCRSIDGAVPGLDQMGAPPRELATPGRANPRGVPYLYGALEEETAISEMRRGRGAQLALARGVLGGDIEVVDLASLEVPDFFLADDPLKSARMLTHVRHFAEELGRPMHRDDRELDYLPTQFLAEHIRDQGFDGIIYPSSLAPCGKNIVIFRHEVFEVVSVATIEIRESVFEWVEIPGS